MNQRQLEALALIDKINRGTRSGEQAINRRALASGEPLDSKQEAVRPHDMVAKLSAIAVQNAILESDNARLSRMNEARQQQGDRDADRSRFAQAVGRQEYITRTDGVRSRFMQAIGGQERGRIGYVPFDGGGRRAPRNDDLVHPEWSALQQAEWEAGRSRRQFQGEREWEEGRPERGRSGSRVRDFDSEGKRPIADPVRASDLAHLSDGERVESVNALKDQAFAQIKEILAGPARRA